MDSEQTKQHRADSVAMATGKEAIVAVIGIMSDLLVSFLSSFNSTMTEFFSDMKAVLESLIVKETPMTEQKSLPMGQPDVPNQGTLALEPEIFEKDQQSDSTKQSITNLISQSSEHDQEAVGKIHVLSGITNDLKLDHKKDHAVKQHLAKIVHGLMRERTQMRSYPRHRTDIIDLIILFGINSNLTQGQTSNTMHAICASKRSYPHGLYC